MLLMFQDFDLLDHFFLVPDTKRLLVPKDRADLVQPKSNGNLLIVDLLTEIPIRVTIEGSDGVL